MDTAAVNWDFVVLFGTILFWTLLHMFSPDGRQWRTDNVRQNPPRETPTLDEVPSRPGPPS
ncbi:MAG: hypothetical protein AB7N65_21115 [Vicinamibacterales bacterium]